MGTNYNLSLFSQSNPHQLSDLKTVSNSLILYALFHGVSDSVRPSFGSNGMSLADATLEAICQLVALNPHLAPYIIPVTADDKQLLAKLQLGHQI